MSLITTVGYIRRDLGSLREWCRQQSATEQSISSRYASGRTHKWFRHEVVLTKKLGYKPRPSRTAFLDF